MAMFHSAPSDFVLFGGEPVFRESSGPRSNENFEGLLYDATPMVDARLRCQLPNQTSPSHDSYQPADFGPTTAPAYFDALKPAYDFTGAELSMSTQRPTPSTSPSSLSQTHDHPPSTLSCSSGASGPSGQSTESSANASPHSHPSHHLPIPDKWPEPLRGLGLLGPGIVNSETFGPDSYRSSNFDAEMVFDESRCQDFVGEYQQNPLSLALNCHQNIEFSFPAGSTLPSPVNSVLLLHRPQAHPHLQNQIPTIRFLRRSGPRWGHKQA